MSSARVGEAGSAWDGPPRLMLSLKPFFRKWKILISPLTVHWSSSKALFLTPWVTLIKSLLQMQMLFLLIQIAHFSNALLPIRAFQSFAPVWRI